MISIHIDFTVSNLVGVLIVMGFLSFCLLLYWVGMDDGLNTHVHGSEEE